MTVKYIILDLDLKSLLFKSLGDNTRLRILEVLLNKKSECVQNIAEKLNKDQSTIFRHISLLRASGIIKTQKQNKKLMCSLKSKEKLSNFFKFVNKCQKDCI